MKSWTLIFGLACCLCCLHDSATPAQENDRTLIKAQHVITVSGETISPGQVLVQDGKISFVGNSIQLSLPAREIEVDTLIPGLINAAGSTGLAGGDAEVSREITPDFATVNAIDWQSREFLAALSEGVTAIQVLPATESVFSGFACLVKPAGENKVVQAEQGVVLAVCSDPTSRNRSRSRPDSIYVRQPTNRMGVVWIIRNALHQAQNQGDILGVDPETKSVLEGIVDGTVPVLAVSRKDYDIRSTMQLDSDYSFQPTVYGGDEVYRMIDEFKASGSKLVYTALTTSSTAGGLRGREGSDLRWNVPGILHQSDISFCLAGENLLDQARFAVRYGLPTEVALSTITLRPASFLGISETHGSIEVGKFADLVGLSGDPLQPTTNVEWTMVDGTIYGSNEE